MAITAGTRLGPYEILSAIGAGGMGEVYRAKDTRLDRIVAIKILPAHLSTNPDLKLRFEREAKTISSLSHSHICALYDIGHQDGIDYLVMEFLEGETLAQRIAKATLPTEQVIRYGIQIADALDRAHRQGIVHRDLKPANIMLTRSGAKLLDFGLAKLEQATVKPILSGISALPTEHHDLTAEGTILGTLQYMAPEQLEGREADARTDIFALGVVLYEMATGKKAFSGKSQASLIAAILSSEPPPISTIQPMTPPSLDRVVKTCMAKDPEDRWQTTHDVMLELKWVGDSASQPVSSVLLAPMKKSQKWIPWILSIFLFVALLAALPFLIRYFREPQVNRITGRFEVNAPGKSEFSYSLAISPDGRSLAFVAAREGKQLLWIRRLNSTEERPLSGTENALFPFWSPDSRFIAFFADGKLKKIDSGGGYPQTLCGASLEPRGGSWSDQGIILFSPDPGTGLYQISADGGEVTAVTKLDKSRNDSSHRWPHFLPGGTRYLYFVRTRMAEKGNTYFGSLVTDESKKLFSSDSRAIYSKSGHLLFVEEGSLLAQPFSLSKMQLKGQSFLVSESVQSMRESGATGYSPISISQNDVLVYKKGSLNPITQLLWIDRKGTKIKSVGPTGGLDEPALSPDGRHIAINSEDPKTGVRNIWLLEVNRGTLSRLTFHTGDGTPVWSPDGSRIVFASEHGKSAFPDLYLMFWNKAGEAQLLLETDYPAWPTDWSSDGKYLVYEVDDPKFNSDLWLLPMVGERKPFVFFNSEFNESQGQISPDSQWIAYSSDESGQSEVYVRSFPSKQGRWQISTAGGSMPAWRGDGKELFYLGSDKTLMAVSITSSGNFEAGIPQPLFKIRTRRMELGWNKQYVAGADGQRFLVNEVLAEASASPITVVMNWSAEVQK
jgi:eukaryotic-like serine/threonine-protein kinase